MLANILRSTLGMSKQMHLKRRLEVHLVGVIGS